MFTAVTIDKQKVHISNAIKDGIYYCAACGERLYVRGGDKVARHFYHRVTCSDGWSYEQTEWHREMQNLFPIQYQEVPVRASGEIHIADILIDNTVILFNSGNMSALEIKKRTTFFMESGYRVAWIANFTLAHRNQTLVSTRCHKQTQKCLEYRWNNPSEAFKLTPDVFENNNFAIWLWLDHFHSNLERVIYMPKNEKDQWTMNTFIVDNYNIDFSNPIDPKYLFGMNPGNQTCIKEIARKIWATNCVPPVIKYIGEKHHSKNEYMCDRKRQYSWIRLNGDSGCLHCKACTKIIKKTSDGRTVYEIECNYQNLEYEDFINPCKNKEDNNPIIIDKTTPPPPSKHFTERVISESVYSQE